MIAIAVAYARGRVIGKDGKIPWDIPDEKHRFRDLTTGQAVEGGDTFFPPFDEAQFLREVVRACPGEIPYTCLTYTRKR